MKTSISNERRQEQGVALFATILVLVLVAAIAVAAVNYSGEELAAGGRLRAASRSLYAADAGLQFALNRLDQSPPNANPFSINVDGGATVESRTRDDATPQQIPMVGTAPAPDGFTINVGSTSSFISDVFLLNVTATTPNSGTTELEMKVAAGLKPAS